MDFGNLSSILGDPSAINTMLGGDAITPTFSQQTSQPPDPDQFGAQLAAAPNPDAGGPVPGADQPWQKQASGAPPMPGDQPPMPPDQGGPPSMAPPMLPQRPNPGVDLGQQGLPPGAQPFPPTGPSPMPPPSPGAPGGPPMGGPPPGGPPPGPPQGSPMPQGGSPMGGAPNGGVPFPNFNTPIEPMRRPQEQPSGLMGALGINLSPERRAGLAAGLKSVGTNWNKPGLAAAAGSAGAAMEGSQKEGDQQDERQMKRNQQGFTQATGAFNDLMKSYATGNATKVADAHSAYFQARAQQALATGSTDFRNTPYAKSVAIQGLVFKEADAARKTMEKQWTLNGTPLAQQEIDKQKIQADADARRDALYKQAGIDPAQGQKMANTGLEPPTIKGPDGKLVKNPNFNPFDARQMSKQQFEETVLKGMHYRAEDGKVYKRLYDKPKTGDKVSEVEKSNDDYMAGQPIPEA